MAEPMTETAPEPADTAVDAPVADTDIDALLAEFEAGTQVQPTEQITETAAEGDRAFAANLNAITEGLQLDSRRQELQSYERAAANGDRPEGRVCRVRGDSWKPPGRSVR